MPLTTYTSGEVLTAASLNANLSFAATNPVSAVAIFNETQASGTNGGTSVANAWTKRILNTTNVNTISGCSIASSVITLGAGTYTVNSQAPFYHSTQVKIRLQNTSDATTTIIGTSMYFGASVDNSGLVNMVGQFTITGSKNFELQYYVKAAAINEGLGSASSIASTSEVYSNLQINQVA